MIYSKFIKRVLDFTGSLLLLIILSPILLIVALMVKIRLGSPVIFKQQRPGRHEKIFSIYKFRTMSSELDEEGNMIPKALRVTRFGKMLRSTSLDELPELWNILKGDMSFVGPRPLLVKYLPLYSEEQNQRHLVRPGLTGLAQVNGRNAVTWDEKFQHDRKYVQNLSLLLDVKIILKTIWIVLAQIGISDGTSVGMEEFKGN
ncbi:MAG: sugar transferase [Sphaerochaetaceae bacterium]|jgi:undecaprenyl phosphate N,N'-diacetylbacillosamine 1-phosphate transferase